MNAVYAIASRAYNVHGVRIDVRAQDAVVADVIDLRLRDFGSAPGSAELTLEFIAEDVDGATGASEEDGESGRPVYDTPYGSLHYFPQADVLRGELGGVHLRCDARRGAAVLRTRRFSGRSLYFATHPLLTVSLMELLERRGLYSLHAACLADGDGHGVLVSGASGAGKSTLALALARAGMRFLSDDVVFLAHAEERSPVLALGFSDAIGLSTYAAECFDELRRWLDDPPGEGFPKRLGRIEDLLGVCAIPSCLPRAIVFPEVVHEDRSAIEPLDRGEALLRLVPDVLLTHAESTQAHLAAVAALLGQARCYALRSGRDLERAAELVRGVA
jgi:hypothetical protein